MSTPTPTATPVPTPTPSPTKKPVYIGGEVGCYQTGVCAGDLFACVDFSLKQHDTRPAFKVDITDCDLPIDLTDLVIEASMWTLAKIRTSILSTDTIISFADNVGFEQLNVDTIIQVGNGRVFERMLIKTINEEDKTLTVLRGQLDTKAYNWKKGVSVKLIKFLNNPAIGELEYKDIELLDGTVESHKLVRSTLVYEWKQEDTCMCGKYFIEFKVMKISPIVIEPTLDVGSNVNPDEINYHCDNGANVEWMRRFPNDREGFVISVLGSPTAE